MDTGNKFFNAYVDICVATIQEQLVQLLQHKAQSKIINEIILEKDANIEKLSKELEESKKNTTDISSFTEKAKYWEDSYHAVQNKLSHMETLTRQVADMKNEIIRKNEALDKLEKEKNAFLLNLENEKNTKIQALENQIADLKKKQKNKETTKENAITRIDLNNKANNNADFTVVMENKKKLVTDDF